jgi:hypothetical protein
MFTPLRVGTKRMRRQLLVACTDLYTYYMLGDRSLATFNQFLLPELTGVVVHDRYTVYDNAQRRKTVPSVGSLLCCISSVPRISSETSLMSPRHTRTSTGRSRSPTRYAG